MVTLLAALLVILALLASYGRYRILLAGCSTFASIVAFTVYPVALSLGAPSKISDGVAWISQQLVLLDDQTRARLAAAVGLKLRAFACGKNQTPCVAEPPIQETTSTRSQGLNAASVIPRVHTPRPEATPGFPVLWFFHGESRVSHRGAADVRILGTNISDEALTGVQAALKPDSGGRPLRLSLAIAGDRIGHATTIPPRTLFALELERPYANWPSGGAIMRFKYRYEGCSKATIFYIAPGELARTARGG
jgi:hypothetical protein